MAIGAISQMASGGSTALGGLQTLLGLLGTGDSGASGGPEEASKGAPDNVQSKAPPAQKTGGGGGIDFGQMASMACTFL